MAASNTKDLTVGSPVKLLLHFMIPLVLGTFFQQLYYAVDSVVIGRFLGAAAFAGVGSTGPISFIVTGFCTGLCAGFAIPVAQKFGKRDQAGLRLVAGNIVWLTLIISVAFTVLSAAFCRPVLRWTHTPEETFSYAHRYILIIFLGIPTTIVYNMLASIIRSLGNSKTPLYFLIFSSALNVVLDLVLILVIPMGVAGAALATVLSQLVSSLLCLRLIMKNFPVLHLRRSDLRVDGGCQLQLLMMGVPMGLQTTITGIGSAILQSAINGLGTTVIAATVASGRVFGLLYCPLESFGMALATYVGQNVGAGKLERIHAGTRANYLMGLLYTAVMWVIAWFFCDAIHGSFLSADDPQLREILLLSRKMTMVTMSFPYLALGVVNFRSAIQGMGFSQLAIFSGVMELFGRMAAGLWLVPRFGFTAACYSSILAWALADLFLVPAYFWCVRRLWSKAKAET